MSSNLHCRHGKNCMNLIAIAPTILGRLNTRKIFTTFKYEKIARWKKIGPEDWDWSNHFFWRDEKVEKGWSKCIVLKNKINLIS